VSSSPRSSGELGTYRSEVARVLRRKGPEVREQGHFSQGPATLLERLRDSIEQCDGVVLLVGERSGAFPTDEHVAALGSMPVFEQYRETTGQAPAPYTQWEFLLARYFQRKGAESQSRTRSAAGSPSARMAPMGQARYRVWT